ncbi:MAG: YjbQ family protein [Proteobacteria bacterium]|nr:YjbQ family protein [Pseudomonadota bacterium]
MQTVFSVRTSGPGLYEFTGEVVRFVRESGIVEGLVTLFVQHTSCSLCRRSGRGRDLSVRAPPRRAGAAGGRALKQVKIRRRVSRPTAAAYRTNAPIRIGGVDSTQSRSAQPPLRPPGVTASCCSSIPPPTTPLITTSRLVAHCWPCAVFSRPRVTPP